MGAGDGGVVIDAGNSIVDIVNELLAVRTMRPVSEADEKLSDGDRSAGRRRGRPGPAAVDSGTRLDLEQLANGGDISGRVRISPMTAEHGLDVFALAGAHQMELGDDLASPHDPYSRFRLGIPEKALLNRHAHFF